jgi:hypothetical protein
MKNNLYSFFNYGSLVVVFALIIIMLLDLVPRESFVYLLSVAILLIIARVVLRIYFTMKVIKKE